MALFVDLVALSNGLHGPVQMDSVALFLWIGWLCHHGILRVFSGIGKNHVGIVLKVDGNNITIQDGNYDGITNTFEDAKKDWQTNIYTLDDYRSRMGGIVFANPK